MQIFFVLSAMILGMLYNYNYIGFSFNCNLCIFAGLTIVLPSLFNLQFSDLSIIKTKKNLLIKNIFANYIILPIIAIAIGLLTDDFGIAGGIFLLSTLAGGGMVMNWIKESNSDEKVGIVLFSINILFLLLSFYLFRHYAINFASVFNTGSTIETIIHLPLRDVVINLIIIPLVVSIILRKIFPVISKLIQKNRKIISNVSIFLIIFYLFALENNNIIMKIEISLFIKAFIATFAFYISCFIVAKLLYNTDKRDERAAFWHIITRYITIALAISAYSSSVTFGATIILPIMIAYFIQLPLSIYYSKYLTKNTQADK